MSKQGRRRKKLEAAGAYTTTDKTTTEMVQRLEAEGDRVAMLVSLTGAGQVQVYAVDLPRELIMVIGEAVRLYCEEYCRTLFLPERSAVVPDPGSVN